MLRRLTALLFLKFIHHSLLGLFNDTLPLRASNTQEQIDNRLWRQSVISTFAANVAIVTYNCSKAGVRPPHSCHWSSQALIVFLTNSSLGPSRLPCEALP
jgi:hypothetical protein